jgi:DNA-directed RNA polymerase subunit K/omega
MIDRSQLPNAFEFVTIASARAKQLMNGCVPKIEPDEDKLVKVAQREVATGAVAKVEPAAGG